MALVEALLDANRAFEETKSARGRIAARGVRLKAAY
jgi:hypothetical protein